MTAAVVSHHGPNGFRHAVEFGDQRFDWLVAQRRPFDRFVQVGDVGGMVLVVMDFHRLGVDMRFEGVERIRQWRNS